MPRSTFRRGARIGVGTAIFGHLCCSAPRGHDNKIWSSHVVLCRNKDSHALDKLVTTHGCAADCAVGTEQEYVSEAKQPIAVGAGERPGNVTMKTNTD